MIPIVYVPVVLFFAISRLLPAWLVQQHPPGKRECRHMYNYFDKLAAYIFKELIFILNWRDSW